MKACRYLRNTSRIPRVWMCSLQTCIVHDVVSTSTSIRHGLDGGWLCSRSARCTRSSSPGKRQEMHAMSGGRYRGRWERTRTARQYARRRVPRPVRRVDPSRLGRFEYRVRTGRRVRRLSRPTPRVRVVRRGCTNPTGAAAGGARAAASALPVVAIGTTIPPADSEPDGACPPAADRGKPRDERNVPRTIRGVLDQAGYPWATSHTFRRTVAPLLDEAGQPTALAANQLGHTDPSMTARVYLGRKGTTSAAAAIL